MGLEKPQILVEFAGDAGEKIRRVGIASFVELSGTGPEYYGKGGARVSAQDGVMLKLEPSGRRGATLRGSNGGPPVNISTDTGQVVVRSASATDSASPEIPHAVAKPPQPVEQ